MTMRRTGRLVVVVLATSLAVLDVAEIAAQVAPSPAEPFKFPASEKPTYRPWTKTCWQAQDEKTCATRSDGRLRNGSTTVSVMLFEQDGRSDKILRIMLPHNVMLGPGTRVIVDSGDPMSAAYVVCNASGCVSDHTVSDELVGRMKNGRYLTVQAIDVRGQPISWMVPVADFGKAHDGPSVGLEKFWSIYETPPKPDERPPKPWQDDTLQPHLRPKY
jgi:invasion protein IalB